MEWPQVANNDTEYCKIRFFCSEFEQTHRRGGGMISLPSFLTESEWDGSCYHYSREIKNLGEVTKSRGRKLLKKIFVIVVFICL